MRDYTYELIAKLYNSGGVTDAQLDGTGAEPGKETDNFVSRLSWFTQEQADAVRAGTADPSLADMQEAINIYEGGNA